MSVEEAVAASAKDFADVEEGLVRLSRSVPSAITAARDAGKIGAIETMQLIGSALQEINGALTRIAILHGELTERAKKAEVDVPAPRSGGGR